MEIQRESIFLSAIRTLLKSFFAMVGFFIAVVPFFIILSFFSSDSHLNKNTLTYLPNANGERKIVHSSAPVVLQINFHGIIGQGDLTEDIIQSQLVESREGILKNNRVKAILLHLDTPGGSVNTTENIYHLLEAYKKKYKVPVHAYVDGLSASGGVYISSACDYISATPSSVIGSVGVILGPFFNVTGTMKKIGLEACTMTEGKDKDMMSPFRPWKDSDKTSFEEIMTYLYDRFIDVVIQSHPKISKEELINTYGARVFDAKKAEEIGFIDNYNGNYKDAINNLLHAAKIDEKTPYQIVELKPKHPWLSDLTKGEFSLLHGKLQHSIKVGKENDQKKLFSYLFEPSLQ